MVEKRYVRPDGTVVWVSNSVTAVGGGATGSVTGGSPTGIGETGATGAAGSGDEQAAAGAAPRSIVLVSQDVTVRKWAEARDRLLVAVDDAVRPLDDAAAITAASVRLLGQFLGADRCAYAEVLDDQDTFDVRGEFAPGLPTMLGRHRLSDFGDEPLRRQRAGAAFVVHDARADAAVGPARLAAYRAAGVAAAVAVPLLKGGRLVAGVAVHHGTPRQWAAGEVELVRAVADRCWESIERARVARNLRDSESRFRELADAMPQIVFMAGPDGHVDYFNRRWYEYTGSWRWTTSRTPGR